VLFGVDTKSRASARQADLCRPPATTRQPAVSTGRAALSLGSVQQHPSQGRHSGDTNLVRRLVYLQPDRRQGAAHIRSRQLVGRNPSLHCRARPLETARAWLRLASTRRGLTPDVAVWREGDGLPPAMRTAEAQDRRRDCATGARPCCASARSHTHSASRSPRSPLAEAFLLAIEGFDGGTAEPALSLHASRIRPEY